MHISERGVANNKKSSKPKMKDGERFYAYPISKNGAPMLQMGALPPSPFNPF